MQPLSCTELGPLPCSLDRCAVVHVHHVRAATLHVFVSVPLLSRCWVAAFLLLSEPFGAAQGPQLAHCWPRGSSLGVGSRRPDFDNEYREPC